MVIRKKSVVITEFPSKDISKWTAIKFAVNRTHRVKGRIRLLIISIINMKFIKITVVP
jgi:hypothetical protein